MDLLGNHFTHNVCACLCESNYEYIRQILCIQERGQTL